MENIKRKEAILATTQTVNALCQKGSKVLGYGILPNDPDSLWELFPKKTQRLVVIYLD